MLNQNNDLKKNSLCKFEFHPKTDLRSKRKETIGSKVQQSAATEPTSVAESMLHCSPTKSHR